MMVFEINVGFEIQEWISHKINFHGTFSKCKRILKNLCENENVWKFQEIVKCQNFCRNSNKDQLPLSRGGGGKLLEKDGINLRKSFRPPQYSKPYYFGHWNS